MNTKGLFMRGAAVAVIMVGLLGGRAYAGGAAYTMSNAPDDNRVIVFTRDDNGLLTKAGAVSTGGKGSGGGVDPLGSQGSLVLFDDEQHAGRHHGSRRHVGHDHVDQLLFAVNAGSNDITVFRVKGTSINQRDRVGSGGSLPVSITVADNRVYVLNNGAPANITGFKLNGDGRLTPMRHSTRLLGDGSYGQVAFGPRGRSLFVTDKANNRLIVYGLDRRGRPSASPVISPSAGAVPFGVGFDRGGHLLVVEAGANAVSSYRVARDGTLKTISASVANGQQATCWIVVNRRGAIITTNPGTHSLSAFHVDARSGQVTLVSGTAGAGNAPLDIDLSEHGRYAYAVDPGNGGVDMFEVGQDGSLISLGTADAGLGAFAQGMAAY